VLVLKNYTPLDIPAPTETAVLDVHGKWYAAGPPVLATQGWKLYISANREDFLATLAAVVPVFDAHRVAYKYIASDKVLRKQNAGLYGYSQVGKVIVGYLEDEARIPVLVSDLKAALASLIGRAPAVPFAAHLGGNWPFYYRYGAYSGEKIVIDGVEQEDDRSRSARALFDRLGDPFAAVSEGPVELAEFDRLLLRYPVYETLSQGGKGGVFAAFDLEAEHFAELVLKIGYRNGQVLPDGRDGMDLIAHEHRFFKLLAEKGVAHAAPTMLDYHALAERNMLVMDRIQGANLLRMREDGELSVTLLERALALLAEIHAAGLYLGDAKLANFVADEGGRIWALDFESSGDLAAPRFDMLRTFHFSRPKLRDHALLDRVHLLYSVLHRGDKLSFSESDRIIDLDAFRVAFEPETEVQRWTLAMLEEELGSLVPAVRDGCEAPRRSA
jgi:hypothetical protein